jgi:hypothetical protein
MLIVDGNEKRPLRTMDLIWALRISYIGFWMWLSARMTVAVCQEHVPQNLAILRHMALNLVKQEKTAKGGVQAKRLQAAWNDDYLLKALSR